MRHDTNPSPHTANYPTERGALLRRALGANVLFSGVSAIVCLAFATALGGRLGLDAGLLRSLGVELAFFGGFVGFLATRPDLERPWVRAATAVVITLDALWVLGSAIVLLSANPLTTAGQWTVGVVALVVADIAFFQALGWRRLGHASVEMTAGNSATAS